MKILRITTELNYGGIEKVFELHAKYNDKSSDLIFVALGKGGTTQQLLQDLGYRVIILNAAKVSIPSPKLIRTIIEIIKKEKPDVVHAAGAEANFHVTIAAKILGVKRIICEEIGIPSHSQKAKLFFRFVYKLSDKVIAISKAVEKYLVSSKEVPASKVSLIYNPVNEATLVNNQHSKDDLLFTVVARLEPVKNLDFLIEVFAEVVKKWPNARLHIIGDGSQRVLLQQQVVKLGLSNSVFLKGFIPNPQPYLSKSTFFVLPSLFEGFGLACIEAIQAGNVAICSDSGGIPEFISDGEQGYLFNPKSKEELLSVIEKAVALSEKGRKQMIASAQTRIRKMFSPIKYIEQLNSLYKAEV